MKVIIAGSRSIHSIRPVADAIRDSGFKIEEVVSGGAQGADHFGEVYANMHGLDLVIFYANWRRWNKAAGVIRSKKMVNYADALIAIWDGKSKGTQHTIELAKAKGIPVFIYEVDTVSWKMKAKSMTGNKG